MGNSKLAFEQLGIVTQTQVIDHRKHQVAVFDSLYEMATKLKKGFDDNLFEKEAGNEYGFTGSSSSWRFGRQYGDFQKTFHAMEFGEASESTLEKVAALRNTVLNTSEVQELQFKAQTTKRRRIFSEVGAELDIDRVLCGDPNHWSRTTAGKSTSVFRLGVNLAINGDFTEDEIMETASLAIIACELLSMAGYSVEMYAMYIGSEHTKLVHYGGAIVKIKGADEKLDISRLCCIGIVGIFRCFTFAVLSQVLDGEVRRGHGKATGLTEDTKKMLNLDYVIDSESTHEKVQIAIGKLITPQYN